MQPIRTFNKKQYPDGGLNHFKSKFCVRGDQQIDWIDISETRAPVLSLITVKFLLVLLVVLGSETQQVDYINAFCQDPLEHSVFVELPKLFEMASEVILLKRSVYGLCQSPLNFYNHMQQGLESKWFKKSEYDDFLITNGTMIVLFWVDDRIFHAKEAKEIDVVITRLTDEFLPKREKDVADFLVIHIDRNKITGTVILTQVGLIDRVMEGMEM